MEEREPTEQQLRAYRALRAAAERIGANNWDRGIYRVAYDRRGWLKKGYTLTEAHERVIKAMPMVLDGTLDPEAAMGLLWEPQVLNERL